MAFDVLDWEDLPFPRSLPEFQRLFPDDTACARYLEQARWRGGFICPRCAVADGPRYISTRPGVLRCRHCRQDVSLTAGTVMARTHTPLSVWFWAAYLVASHTNGLSAVQFQRQLGLTRYETAFQILHKLRAGMVRPDQDRIGASPDILHVEADETYIGGRTRGEGKGVHHMALVAGAVEVRERDKPSARSKRRNGRYAGRVRLALLPNRGAKALGGFIDHNIEPGARIVTDDWTGYSGIGERYAHTAVAERGDPAVAEEYLPIIHLVFSNLKTWLRGTHHGVSPQHLQSYLNEFVFRFNRRFYPFNAFRSLLGIAGDVTAPTYAECYSTKSRTTISSGRV